MRRHARLRLAGAVAAFSFGAPVPAATLSLAVELPRTDAASYYRPYVAVWIESPSEKRVVGTLAVWYDTRLKNDLGRGWLRHLKTWWRSGGDKLALPIDGVSGATRPAGTHGLRFDGDTGPMARLPAAHYELVVEAARENGGRDLLRLPFKWPGGGGDGEGGTQTRTVQGERELGAVRLAIEP